VRPTLRSVLLVAGGVPVSLSATLADAALWPVWLGYLVAVALALGADAALALPARRLAVAVQAPEMLYIGDADPLVVELRASGWSRPTTLELVIDLGDELAPQPAQRASLAGQPVRLELELRPLRRGTARLERAWVRWTGPFGLLRREVIRPLGRELAVVPDVRAVRAAALQFFSNREFLAGLKIERYVGDGSEFAELREYTPGLDHRAIDWKASARHVKLLCREFRAERNHQLIVAVDTGQLMREPLAHVPKLDHAINAGLLLAYVALRTGDRVGMFGFDASVRGFVEPTSGVHGFARLQKASAELAYRTAETNFTLGLAELAARLRRRSLVILLTDFVDTVTAELMVDNIQRLARRHVVVFVTLRDPTLAARVAAEPADMLALHRTVVAAELVREREIVLQRLRQRGIFCIDASPRQVSSRLVNRYLEIKRRELV
jgi:uncharacterized protein (DUF58 family)